MIWSLILCFSRCLNLYSARFLFNAIIELLWAICPNVNIIFKFFIFWISELKNILQFLISFELGLLFGGNYFTEFVILHVVLIISLDLVTFTEKLCLFKSVNNISPEKSPLKILPVLFAPLNPGAKPTIKSSLVSDPIPKTLSF